MRYLQLDDVARVEARELHVEVPRRGVHADRGIVRGPFAVFDGFVGASVASVDARAAELNHLPIRLVLESVLSGQGSACVVEGLEHDLTELAAEAVLVDRGHGQVAEHALVLPRRRRVPQLQELLALPGPRLVGPRLLGLDVLDVLAHVLVLRSDLQDAPKQGQLFVASPQLALEICQCAQRADVLRSEGQRALIGGDGALRLALSPERSGGDPMGPLAVRIDLQQAFDPACGRRAVPTGQR